MDVLLRELLLLVLDAARAVKKELALTQRGSQADALCTLCGYCFCSVVGFEPNVADSALQTVSFALRVVHLERKTPVSDIPEVCLVLFIVRTGFDSLSADQSRYLWVLGG